VQWSHLDIDDDAFPTFANPATAASRATAWAAGVNWFFNRNVKWQFDYEDTAFEGGETGGRDRKDEQALMTRIQLAF
jgi:phosphate-selective porin OprO/OprP